MSYNKRLRRGLIVVLVAAFVTPILSFVPASAALVAPTLVSPSPAETIGGNPILRWTAVPTATSYRVHISKSPSFSPLEYSATTYNTTVTPPNDLPLGILYWRVAAEATGAVSPYADSTFEKTWAVAPALIAPADDVTLDYPEQPPTFAWQPLAGSKSYRLEIDNADDFVGASAYTTSATTFTLTEPQTIEPQVWYWRVQGVSSNSSVNSQWSEVRSYQIRWDDAPTLLAPPNTTLTSIEEVALAWEPVAGARTYQVQVSPNGDWTNNLSVNATVKGTRYSPPVTLDNGSYFWRVRALDGASSANAGPWSVVWEFSRAWADIPTLVSPIDQDFTAEIPELRWTGIDHASHYELQVGTDANFSPNTFDWCFTNRTSYTPYVLESGTAPTPGSCPLVEIPPGQLYYWRVRGIDAPNSVNGQWSATWSFIFRPDEPTPLSPANNTTVSAPVLSWTQVSGAVKYRIKITDANGALRVNQVTYATSYTPTVELSPADGPFRWWVVTIDKNNKEGVAPAPQNAWRFSLEAPAETFQFPDPVAPAENAESVRAPSLQWQPVTNAAHYTVKYGVAGSNLYQIMGSNLPFAAFTYAGQVPTVGTYSWFVEAYSAGGALLSVGLATRFRISDLELAIPVSPADCEPSTVCTVLADTPTLEWQRVPNAGFYLVHLALDPSFTNVVRVYDTAEPHLSPRESLLDNQAGQAYYWFVQPCKAEGRCGRFNSTVHGTARAFQKRSAGIQLVSPADDATVSNQTTFSWTEFFATNGALTPPVSQGARQYRIQVSTVQDFQSLVDDKTVDQLTFTPFDRTYPEGPLYWRVQAIDGSQQALTWSATRKVTKSSPSVSLLDPADGSNVAGIPAFSWTPQPYAARYRVQVFKNGDTQFSDANRVFEQDTKMAAWAPSGSMAAGTYAWRVRRIDADGLHGPWSSDVRVFTLSPSAPTLVEPPDATTTTGEDLVFQWTAVPGAAKYRFELSSSSSFASVSATDTVMTSWAPVTKPAEGRSYWRVKALDGASNVLSVSNVRSFVKDATRPTITTKSPTSQASITGVFQVFFSEPVLGVSEETFKMNVAGTTEMVAGRVTPNADPATAAIFDPTPVLVPGETYTLTLTDGIADVNGNTLAPTSWTVRASTIVDNGSPAMPQGWDRDVSSAASGSYYDGADLGGATSTFKFTGTNVSFVGRRAPDGGYADIYLDGVRKATVSFYASTVQWQRTLWSISGLTDAPHTVVVRALGTRPSGSRGTWVWVDAFKVGSAVYQESSAADRFRVVSTTSALGGSYEIARHLASGDTGSRPWTSVRFKGTGFEVYATKSTSSGYALIYIDGVARASVDLYATSTIYKARVYSSPTLSNGFHSVSVYVAGTKRAASSGYYVGFDRIVAR